MADSGVTVPTRVYTRPANTTINSSARGRTTGGATPSKRLRTMRNESFAGVPTAVAHARCFFPSSQRMHTMGFRMSKAFFSPTHALTKARKKQRGNESRVITKGTCFIDFKGRFPPSKDGGYASVLGFKHPASKHVHEHYLTNQRVDTTEKAFAHYKDMMCKFSFWNCDHGGSRVFDRDPSFNEEFSIYLRSLGVHPDTAGAEDHDKLGPIETYWGSWYANVTAALTLAGLDETHWKFASHKCTTIATTGCPTAATNEGSISPMEWLTYYTPDVSHFRAPFSPSYVVQPKNKQTNIRPRARAGIFCGSTRRRSAQSTNGHAPHCPPKTAVSTPLHAPLSTRLDEISSP
jgi:hypothetical protein